MNVYIVDHTAPAARFDDAVLRIAAAYEAAARFADDTMYAIDRARANDMDTTAMEAVHAEDCALANSHYAALLILLERVTNSRTYSGISGGWRVRVDWHPHRRRQRLNVYAEVIE